jgi:hypothetical protein
MVLIPPHLALPGAAKIVLGQIGKNRGKTGAIPENIGKFRFSFSRAPVVGWECAQAAKFKCYAAQSAGVALESLRKLSFFP